MDFFIRKMNNFNSFRFSNASAILFNSYQAEPAFLRRLKKPGVCFVHRVDGPISAYRGSSDEIDRRIWELNQEFADATIFQSQYSLQKHQEMGLTFKFPTVIYNAPDPRFFFSAGKIPFARNRKTRIIATSWSDNPNKGLADFEWLDQNLDWKKYEFTFVGRIKTQFRNIRQIPPQTSHELGNLLRQHDIYLTASSHDPCSNALMEAIASGLPVVFKNSGGHPELVKTGGLSFSQTPDVPKCLEDISGDYLRFQNGLFPQSLSVICLQYIQVLQTSIGYSNLSAKAIRDR